MLTRIGEFSSRDMYRLVSASDYEPDDTRCEVLFQIEHRGVRFPPGTIVMLPSAAARRLEESRTVRILSP